MSNSAYWVNKEERARAAREHAQSMDNKYKKEIDYSIQNTTIYDDFEFVEYDTLQEHDIKLVEADSVSAAISSKGNTCVLNFASYKNPGGMFLAGSKAQEECLCHESTLYNVLINFRQYYTENQQNLNRALYTNRALYSKDIVFEREHDKYTANKKIDVLTCAAPNYSAANKYCRVSKEENSRILRDRIRFVISILDKQKLDTIVLGAFGCGVFGQDAYEVATIFKEELAKLYGEYHNTSIICAVIDSNSKNYKDFYNALKGN